MTAKSYFRGHSIIWVNDEWVYEDTGEKPGFGHDVRPCKKCGRLFEESNIDDPDPCLGILPGVESACCGHGVRDRAYIKFTNGVVVKGFVIDPPNNAH
jgi:hypothetical protein